MKSRTLLVALLLVLSGCGSGGPATESPSPITAGTAGETPTATASPTSSPTPTAKPPQNPWLADPVKVAVADSTVSNRSWEPLVREAIAFWNGEGAGYTDYEYEFVLVNDSTTNADVVVEFVDGITYCSGYDESTVGCAPIYEQVGAGTGEPTVIEIEDGFTNESTLETIEHEFGHTLGLDHGEADRLPLMNATSVVNETSIPNATDREWPWERTNFTVYVDAGAGVSDQHAQREAEQALTYYENDPDDWLPREVSFEMTGNESAADLVIEMRSRQDCLGGEGVCWTEYGYSPDGDPALEYYTEANVTVVGVDKDHYGWYVGYGLGRVFGAETESELPPPFADADDADDRWFR